MADQTDLDFTYTTIDKIFRLSMGDHGDYSGAKYDGDFSMTLEEAQEAKHKFIADSLNITKGSKVLDMACGWGPFSNYIIKDRGATSIGLTLSQGQADACNARGMNVKVQDCRNVKPEMFGTFDAITCIGGLEHFCTIEDWQAGKQEQLYRDFFDTLYELLPVGGRFYMQTMVFSKNMIPFEDFDLNAERGSVAHVLALMVEQFPGSWLPYGPEMVENCAAPKFKLISRSSGRLDYIETIKEWKKRFNKFGWEKHIVRFGSLIPRYIFDKKFRQQLDVFKLSPNRVCFEDESMDHFRYVFEKV